MIYETSFLKHSRLRKPTVAYPHEVVLKLALVNVVAEVVHDDGELVFLTLDRHDRLHEHCSSGSASFVIDQNCQSYPPISDLGSNTIRKF